MRRAFSVAVCTLAVACGTGSEGDSGGSGVVALDVVDAAARKARGHGLAEWVRAQAQLNGMVPIEPAPHLDAPLVRLGRNLAFDKILSGDRDISCMTCHHPDVGSDDDRSLPIGTGGSGLGPDRTHPEDVRIPRNAPPLFNLHAADSMFWDSRVVTAYNVVSPAGDQLTPEMIEVLELGAVSVQALFPVTSVEEMRGHGGPDNEIGRRDPTDFTGIWSDLMARLGAIPEYVSLFEEAYPGTSFDEMTFAHAANAIAAFEVDAFEAVSSPWQRFLAGDDRALNSAELRGAKKFFQAGCASCHNGPMLSDFAHHNTGMPQFGPGKGDGVNGTDDFGRFRESDDPADLYAFRTPSLVNVELTAPYGHLGQFPTLRAHIAHYVDPAAALLNYDIESSVDDVLLHDQLEDNAQAKLDAGLAADLPTVKKRDLAHLVKFLRALTDPVSRDPVGLVPDSVPSGLPVED